MKLDVAPRRSKIVRNAEASRAKILDAARIEQLRQQKVI